MDANAVEVTNAKETHRNTAAHGASRDPPEASSGKIQRCSNISQTSNGKDYKTIVKTNQKNDLPQVGCEIPSKKDLLVLNTLFVKRQLFDNYPFFFFLEKIHYT